MTRHKSLFTALAADFEPNQVRQRTQAGRTLHYITSRTAMNRLDEVLGPENWKDEYRETAQGAIVCRIWFRVPGTDEWLWREDGGAAAGMAEADNDAKSGFSDAFKRTAVKLGVGRILYGDGVPEYAAEPRAPEPPPRLDPVPSEQRARVTRHAPAVPPPNDDYDDHPAPSPSPSNDRPPQTGRQLFAWVCKQQDNGADKLLFKLNAWAKREGLAGKMVDWDAGEVAAAHQVALEILGLAEPVEA